MSFTWTWDGDTRETLIEIDFEERDGITTVRFTHSRLWDAADRSRVIRPDDLRGPPCTWMDPTS